MTDFSLYTNGLSEQEQLEMIMKMSLEESEKEKKEEVIDDSKLNTKIISQWVKTAKASSQYGGWNPQNMVGKSNTYPKYGDLKTAWAPSSSNGTKEWVELTFEKHVVPTKIIIYETYNPGACVKISGKDKKGNWVELWSGSKQPNIGKATKNEQKLKQVDFLVNEIRLDMDCTNQTSYYEIDAVELFGTEVKLPVTVETTISFGQWYKNTNFSDITFIVDNVKIPGHKFVIANGSSKLLNMCKEKSEIVINDQTLETFETILKYLYTGRFSLNDSTVQPVLKAADYFEMVELRKSCFEFMVASLNKDTVIETMLKAQRKEFDFNAEDLVEKCSEFIQEKAYEVFPEKTLYQFDSEIMLSLTRGDKLCIDEWELYETLFKWGENTVKPGQQLDEHLAPIMKNIRWPLLEPEQLYKVKTSENYGKFLTEDQYIEAIEYNLDPSLFKTSKEVQFRDRGKIFKGSTILNAKHGAMLLKLLGGKKKYTLLYQGSKHGFAASNFHQKCDGKGATVTVVQSTSGQIFGGYNPVPWNSNGGYSNDSKTYLYTLVNTTKVPPSKFPIMAGKNGAYSNSGYGPTFGGGHDLYICSNCTSANSNYTNFGYSFTSPPGLNSTQKQAFLAGGYNFTVKDIEVYLEE
eukprot:gene5516-9333_t